VTKRKPYGLEPAHPPEEQRRINEESLAAQREEARRQLMLHIEVRASMKAAQSERERAHLLEGARLCMLARPLLDAPIFEDEREAFALWFDAEDARLSATVEPGPACAEPKE
jgi:hypothetical protein